MTDRPPPPDPGRVTQTGSWFVVGAMALIGIALIVITLVIAYTD